MKSKIYIASKAHHRERWRGFRKHYPTIISRWIDVDDKYLKIDLDDNLDYTVLWEMCFLDVRRCDILMVYSEPQEILKGALVEVGMALALEKQIIVVGSNVIRDQGTWWNLPQIKCWPDDTMGSAFVRLHRQETDG